MESELTRLCDRVRTARAARTPLRLRGAGTKDFYGEELRGDILDTRGYAGIVSYEPAELVITARCGTRLSQIELVLAQNAQFLAFEPPRFGGDPTIGGIIAAGLSGPRRASAGAARDFVLGAKLVDANGNVLSFGGQVMKNVAGFDVSRLLCGSLGTLGMIADVSLKVLPLPRAEATLCFGFDSTHAIEQFNRWSAQPLPVSATAWQGGTAYLRLSGNESAVNAAVRTLGGEVLASSLAQEWWSRLRDQTHAAFAAPRLWRLSLPATAVIDLPGTVLVEWAGSVRWLATDAPTEKIRGAVEACGGSATLWRGTRDTPMFHPLSDTVLNLHRRLKQQFDPYGIFNLGRLLQGV